VITNFSAPANFFEIGVTITLDIEVPVERALVILRTAAIEASPLFSPRNAPAPSVSVRAITLQGVEYTIFVFPTFKTRARARNQVQQHVLKHLNFAGLTTARLKQEMRRFVDGQDYRHSSLAHIAKLLGETGLFQDLSKPELQLLADSALIRHLPENSLLVQGGEIASSMFLVLEGLLVADEWRKKVGRRTEVEDVLLGPGYLISSSAMLAGDSYDSTIKSKTTALLCEINYAAIEALLLQNPQLGGRLSRRVAEEINQAVARGEHSRYGQENLKDITSLTAKVFTNLRRSFAHLELS
jgi:CRP-like cAMP-binding protein